MMRILLSEQVAETSHVHELPRAATLPRLGRLEPEPIHVSKRTLARNKLKKRATGGVVVVAEEPKKVFDVHLKACVLRTPMCCARFSAAFGVEPPTYHAPVLFFAICSVFRREKRICLGR